MKSFVFRFIYLTVALLLLMTTVSFAADITPNIIWLEAENEDVTSNLTSTTALGGASGGSAITLRNVSPTGSENYHLDYTFNVNSECEYDIWVVSTRPNIDWVSDFKYSVDGADAVFTDNSGTKIGYVGVPARSDYQPVGLFGTFSGLGNADLTWNPVTTVNFAAGNHNISIMPVQRVPGGYIWAFDCIVMVPSAYNWKPIEEAAKLNVDWVYAACDLSVIKNAVANGITDAYTFPSTGAYGSTMTYTSGNTDYITNAGVVTQPLYSAADAEVTVNVTSVCFGATLTEELAVTVKKLGEFSTKNFGLTGSVTGGSTVTATAEVRNNVPGSQSNATLLAVLKDSEGAIVSMTMDSCALTADYSPLSAGFTLPADVTGHKLYLYLWDDLIKGNIISSSVVY